MIKDLSQLTDNEQKLIYALRSLHPYEKIVISADKEGKVDSYLIERTYKEMWIAIDVAPK